LCSVILCMHSISEPDNEYIKTDYYINVDLISDLGRGWGAVWVLFFHSPAHLINDSGDACTRTYTASYTKAFIISSTVHCTRWRTSVVCVLRCYAIYVPTKRNAWRAAKEKRARRRPWTCGACFHGYRQVGTQTTKLISNFSSHRGSCAHNITISLLSRRISI